jgi:hypothetical protein
MAGELRPVRGPLHTIGARFPTQANKRVIATDDPARIVIPSDYQEPRELSSGFIRHRKPSAGSKAKKRLIATFDKLKIESTNSQQRTSHFSNRNKFGISRIAAARSATY